MKDYHLVVQQVAQGAFDHWVGQTVPLRGPDRQIIGEATVKLVEQREDGNVCVVVESQVDLNRVGMQPVTDVLQGRSGMSFSVPHQPKRDDDVARWLRAKRERFMSHDLTAADMRSWTVIDDLLNEYRARADYGLTLDDNLSALPEGY